ncbi:MAG: flagellar biosynthesis protein FlhF [Pirellulales bacterium]
MEIHTFRAGSLQEALMLVRSELGPDASVIRTRETAPRLFGMWGKRGIEVEATRDAHGVRRVFSSPDSSFSAMDAGHDQEQFSGDSDQPNAASTFHLSESGVELPVDHFHDTSDQNSPLPTTSFSPSDYRNANAPVRPSTQGRSSATAGGALSPAMFEVFTDLLDSDVEPEAARLMLQQAAGQLSPQQLDDPWLIKGRLCQVIQQQIQVSGPIRLEPGHGPMRVALVGPTGVGKTTTLAKLAAGLHFESGAQVGFITLDTFRLGAVDQLRQYAELMAAPLEVVSSIDQLKQALVELDHCSAIFIDTAGRSPRDAAQLDVLKQYLDVADPHETHLVLSAAASRSHAQMAMEQFAALRPNRLLLSKLDESACLGGWYPILSTSPWPLSYLTNGQHVPEDLLTANRRRVAGLIMGQSAKLAWN